MIKRFFDFVTAGLGLIFLTPLFLIIAILIKSNSKGPVFYKQPRVGRGGILFHLFKFRTMQVGADKATAITVGHRDPRITPVGYFLRKFKLDELPQLINVLIGEMSLVGPRPELQKFVNLYDEHQLKVISVKPGITDYASIQFRNENEMLAGKPDPVDYYIKEIMPAKLNLNLQYIANQSFLTDLKIIGHTIFLVFFRK